MEKPRGSNRLGIRDLSVVLAQMYDARQAAVTVGGKYPIGGDVDQRAKELLTALDNLSEALTGDRKAHWPISVAMWPPREFDVSHLLDD